MAGGQWGFAGVVEAVSPDCHVAVVDDLRVELADGAGAGVAGVGVEGFAVAFALFVHASEAVKGEIDFAAGFQHGRVIAVQTVGYAGNFAEVAGDVLAGLAVAAGCAQDQLALLIDQAHGEAVDFELRDHAELLAVEQVGDAAMPGFQAFTVKGVGQAEHGYGDAEPGGNGRMGCRR